MKRRTWSSIIPSFVAHCLQCRRSPAKRHSSRAIRHEPLEARLVLAPTVLITEFMAQNTQTLFNAYANGYPDWIELYNPGPDPVDLQGWYLTDNKNELHGWQVPKSLPLAVDQYVVIFASGETRSPDDWPAGEWFANFKLNNSGEYLGLVMPDGTTIVAEYEPSYPPQTPDISYGLVGTLDDTAYFNIPTPGAVNAPAFDDGVFNVSAGLFTIPQKVFIDTSVLHAPVRYTLDGSTPTATDPLYTDPIIINTTRVLRAKSFAADSDGLTYTRTYIFPSSVAIQPSSPPGLPAVWQTAGGQTTPADYQFDPEVATTPQYSGAISDALSSLPSMSLVVNPTDLFGADTGIYSNPQATGDAWERPASLELIDPAGNVDFRAPAGVRIDGNDRDPAVTPKHSFRLTFRTNLGLSTLEEALFDNTSVDKFKRLKLTALADDTWLANDAGARTRATLAREQWLRETQRAMGNDIANARFVHLYLNGLYWGVYLLGEDIENDFAEIHHGGDNSEYDVIDGGIVTAGVPAAWNSLLALATGPMNDATYAQALQLLDLDSFIDFMILRNYAGYHSIGVGAWYAMRNRVRNEGFQFYAGSAGRSLNNLNDNFLTSGGVDAVRTVDNWLRQNLSYRREFGDRVQLQMTTGGPLTASAAGARWTQLTAPLHDAVVAESARWGDYRRDVAPVGSAPFELYTRNAHWDTESQRLLTTYFPSRTAEVVGQLRGQLLFPMLDAPVFSRPAGDFEQGSSVSIQGLGKIYYTLDGTEPVNLDGTPTASAVLYTSPIALAIDTVLSSRAVNANFISALNVAVYTTRPPLRISEILYHANKVGNGDDDDFDFIEIANVSNVAVDLTGMKIDGGVEFAFDEGAIHSLAAGARLVVARNPVALAQKYDLTNVRIAGAYAGRLNNSGEQIRLAGSLGQTIVEVTYSDEWSKITDTEGFSLVPRNESVFLKDWSNPELWRASQYADGSPGLPDGGINPGDIVISEGFTHSDGEQGDYFELHNTTDHDIDIGGWYMSETPQLWREYTVKPGVNLPADGYLIFSQGPPEIAQGFGGETGFLLSKVGDTVKIASPGRIDGQPGGFRLELTFGYGFNGTSYIRYTNTTGQSEYVLSTARTPGTVNAPPTVDHIWDHGQLHLAPMISEIMYDPAPGGDEYIEIYNPHDKTVYLDEPFGPSWRFIEGINYNLPDGLQIAPHRHVLVVPIDPAAFRTKYNVPAETQIFGPYIGDLLNSGEMVVLGRPAEPGAFVPFASADRIFYNHPSAPWPAAAKGQGASLNRISPIDFGGDVTNWVAGTPTPGRPNVDSVTVARVVSRQTYYNNSTYDKDSRAANDDDFAAIAWDKVALRNGQRATFANYTNYSKGINGILIGVRGFANFASLAASDFVFRVGNSDDPSAWAIAPAPAQIRTIRGATADDRDFIQFTWPDGAITQHWLQVTVKASVNTGLPAPDVFYFGNAIGETGNSTSQAIVDFADLYGPEKHLTTYDTVVAQPYDFNRDGAVDEIDANIVRANLTGATGDLNVDGVVDRKDVARLISGFGRPQVDAYYGDLTGNFSVGMADLVALQRHLGETTTPAMRANQLRLIHPSATSASPSPSPEIPTPSAAAGVIVATVRQRSPSRAPSSTAPAALRSPNGDAMPRAGNSGTGKLSAGAVDRSLAGHRRPIIDETRIVDDKLAARIVRRQIAIGSVDASGVEDIGARLQRRTSLLAQGRPQRQIARTLIISSLSDQFDYDR